MRICHITPHLPPDQAANALLPYHLGEWAREAGDEPVYVAHPPRAEAESIALPGDVTWVARRRTSGVARSLRAGSLVDALAIARLVTPIAREADLVHVHSNGLLAEIGGLLAEWLDRPTVLTLYGTEIWHYRRGAPLLDLFTRMYFRASRVAFYSRGLLNRASELGLARPGMTVIYPPVAAGFTRATDAHRAAARASLGIREANVLVNVKRLHPLAGQRYLIDALPHVLAVHPDTRLIICGTGPMQGDLVAGARAAGVEDRVTFAGLVDNRTVATYDAAADVFVLPSLLEACPTVALEALACGTPVVSSDNPGGLELGDLFGDDVAIVAREDAPALARAINGVLGARRRTSDETRAIIERDFRPDRGAAAYRVLYRDALSRSTRKEGS